MDRENEMEFKRLTEKDLLSCAHLFVDIFNDKPWNDEWTVEGALQYITEFYQTPNFLGLLAIENGELLGFIYGVTRSWWSGYECYIHEMGVKKVAQGQGLGTALLNQLVNELDEKVSFVSLLTDRGMPAENFYQKNGFQEIDRLVFYSKDL